MNTDRELELYSLTVQSPFVEGREPEWRFPDVCGCCGAAAQARYPQRLVHEGTQTKWWLDVKVPYCGVCVAHVDARARSTRATGFITIVLTALVVTGALFAWMRTSNSSLMEALDQIFQFPMFLAYLIPLALVYFVILLIVERIRSSGSALPATDACTMPLWVSLVQDKFRLITEESKLVVRMITGCRDFSEAFASVNEEYIEEAKVLRGTLTRSPRGDWLLKKTVEVAEEPAAV